MNEILIKILSIERIDEYEYNTTSNDFSINDKKVLYNNDGSFKSIKVSENIFANILDKDLNKEATKRLKELVGKCFVITENGQKVNIDRTFTKEYIYSKYSFSIDEETLFLKQVLTNYLEEIINNSHDKTWKSNTKLKHKKDAKYGFYKYKIELFVKINDIEEKYIATILIRNASNKKKYLYDILNIKKID